MFESLIEWSGKAEEKAGVYASVSDGSFDQKDKERLKPLTRVREDMEEIKKERENDLRLRIKDWLSDIDGRG
jgi:hypothetical protein